MRTPGAVPNLCKADSGLSAMIGILVAISSHLVAPSRYEDTFLYLLLSNSAPSVRAQDKGARILAPPPSLGCFGAGARGPGARGLAPITGTVTVIGTVAATAFSTYKSPNFYLSFTSLS